MQVGFKSKTDSDPVFRLAFTAASVSFAEQAGSGAITMPVSADETTDIGTNETDKAEISITPSEISVNDEFTIQVIAPGADGVRLWNGKRKELVQEIPLAGFDTFRFTVQSFVPGTAIFYITTSHNGVWSDEPDSTAKVVTKAPLNYQGLNVISAESEKDFLGTWKSTKIGINDGKGSYNVFDMSVDQDTLFELSSGHLFFTLDNEVSSYDTSFEDGILFSSTGAFELTEDGHLTWPQTTGGVVYLEKISDTVTEKNDTASSAGNHDVVLSSTAYEAAVGESFTVTVSAPGAKSVQLIDIDQGNFVVKEGASDKLDIYLSSAGPAVFHLVGLAFFDGSEEGIRSNEIYVTVSDNITPGQANDPVLGGWKLYSYTSLIDGQPDMPNCFFENDNNFRNSPLGADRLELIFMGNQVYKALTLDGKINVETGTWKKENSNYYITYDSGETEGPYYLLNDDNGLAIKIPGEGNKAAHIQFNRMEMTEEKFNEILAALDGNN